MTRWLVGCSAALLTVLVITTPVVAGQVVPPAPPPGGPPGVPQTGLPPRDVQRRTGTSRLRGRIVAADTGLPLRRATVRAMAPELREAVATFTGTDGQYELKELPAGRYSVTASKGAYASLSYGQTRAFEGGRPIELGENQTIDRIDLRLPRGGVITGVITDEFGEPVSDAQVMTLRQQYMNGQRRLLPAGRSATSDDVGGFRVFGLTPGTYYVSVTLRAQMTMGTRSDDRTGYAPTYYPGTSDVASAQRLTVTAGQTVTDINLSLVPTQTAELSGIVLNGAGERVRNGMVMAMPRGFVPQFGPSMGQIRPDGTFAISGMPPGEYTLRWSGPPDAGGSPTVAMTSVTVNGQDVSGIQLAPSPQLMVSGRLTLDGGAVQTLSGSAIQLRLAPTGLDDLGFGIPVQPATARDDLSFEMKAVPGPAVVRVFGDPRWSLKAVRYRGADITDSGLDLRPGGDLTDLEVELTSQKQEVSGLVTTAAGKPSTSYTVVIFARDRERWSGASRFISIGRPDQEGRFRVRSLPPGDYYAVALEAIEPGLWMDPDFLDSVRYAAVDLTLAAGETKVLDLRLAVLR